MADIERKCRGSVIFGYVKYAKKAWGQDGMEEMCKAVDIDPKELKEGAWYPDEINDRIFKWLEEAKGFEYIEKANIHITKDLGLLSFVVRFANVKTVLNKFPSNYKELFNYGRIEIEHKGEGESTIKLFDCATTKYSCPAWIGAFKGALEMTNTKGEVEEVKCQLNGEPHCEFHVKWG